MKKINIITGHYGSGKTTVALNTALKLARENKDKKISIVDLDIVNPYFRTSDFAGLLGENNIEMTAPAYAGSNLDIPAVNFDIERIIDESGYTVIDVGGDDAGAYALGRYAPFINSVKEQTDMFYVINRYRYLTRTPAEAAELMYEIEQAARIKHTGIINNSSLGFETTAGDIDKTHEFAVKVSEETGLPLVFTAYRKGIKINTVPGEEMELFVKPVWEQ